MPFIEFPNVPLYPGVPDLKRASTGIGVLTGITQQIQKLDSFGIISKFFNPAWVLTDANGSAVITPDSVLSVEYRGEQKISNFPIEKGSFASYNKIAIPFDLRVTMTCNGQGEMTRDAFLARLEAMKNSLELYTFITPDFNYESVNLEHYDYRRDSSKGVQLITADLFFTEIRVVNNNVFANTVLPSGAGQQINGSINIVAPTKEQAASFTLQAIQ